MQAAPTSYTCPKCTGTGYLSQYAGIAGGVCFSCAGRGVKLGKAPTPSATYAVYGVSRATGAPFLAYNKRAKTAAAAIKAARKTFAGASAEFRAEVDLEHATAEAWR